MGKFLKTPKLFVISLFAAMFVGFASASGTDDIRDGIDTFNDVREIVDITIEGAKLLNKQREDPTNSTLLAENLVEMTKDLSGVDNIENTLVTAVYLQMIYSFIYALAPIILPVFAFIVALFH